MPQTADAEAAIRAVDAELVAALNDRELARWLGLMADDPVVDRGKDVSIYARQPDGSWQVVVDMWSGNGE